MTAPHLNAVELRLCLEALPLRERQLVEHLLGCPPCREMVGSELRGLPGEEARYDRALQRAVDRAAEATREAQARVAEERAAALRRLDELWALRPDHWPAFFLAPPSPAFLLLVLDTASRVVQQDPGTAETLARHVRAAALRRETKLPETLRAEVIARAWAVAGRARAERGEWTAADSAFQEASRSLTEHPNLLAEAELCRFQAAAFAARDRLTEAAGLLARAALLAGEAGQVVDEIGDLAELARLSLRRGDLDESARLLARALLRADDAGLTVAGAQLRLRLSWTLRQLGELRDAARVAPPFVVSALREDAALLLVATLLRVCRGETTEVEERLERAAKAALMSGDGLLAAVAAVTLLGLYVLEDRADKLADLAGLIGLLSEPQNGLAAETRVVLTALETALQTGMGTLGVLLLAAAAALDRHEGVSPDETDSFDLN